MAQWAVKVGICFYEFQRTTPIPKVILFLYATASLFLPLLPGIIVAARLYETGRYTYSWDIGGGGRRE